jgi:arginine decarboxylase
VRVKLASEGAGRWRDSAGEKSKFGLFVTEILDMVKVLREHNMLDCLELVHCHPGSQLQDIRRVKDAINELAHVYAELQLMGAGLKYIDVGGGLGVDYDGSGTNFESSMNYTINEYASDVVYRIASVCNAREIEHPVIVSESGARRRASQRADLQCARLVGARPVPRRRQHRGRLQRQEELPQPVLDLFEAHRTVSERGWSSAITTRCRRASRRCRCSISAAEPGVPRSRRAAVLGHVRRIRDYCRKLERVPEELEGLELILSDTYFCNFSVFQSLPDSWAIGQQFPIMPIHRLNEKPTRNAVLADITCDSDGKIDRFVSQRDVKRTLELHELKSGEEYYLAAFLVGAYQETAGRSAQPVRRYPRRAHPSARRRRLVDRRDRARATPPAKCSATCSTTSTGCSRSSPGTASARARKPPDARGEPGPAALLRIGAARLHLPRTD